MAYTPFLCTVAEIALFTKDVVAADFGLTSEQFIEMRAIVHSAAEVQILQFLNRTDLTSAVLATFPIMEATLKHAAISLVSNFFVYWKAQKAGKVIQLGDLLVTLLSPEIFTKDLKEALWPHRIPKFGTIDPDETITIAGGS